MFTERQAAIIRFLSEVKFAKMEQLAEVCGVSEETIRRDLLELEKGSAIERVRGGAMFNAVRGKEMEFDKQMGDYRSEKRAIARCAVDFISAGDALVIGNGTTNILFAKLLAQTLENLTVITNSPEIAGIISKNETHQVYLTGGKMRSHNGSLVGSMCLSSLDGFRVDKAVVNIDGLTPEDGVTEFNVEEAAVIRRMLEIAKSRMVLSEYAKFGVVALNRVCPANTINTIVTDWNVPSREIRLWGENGTRIVSAPKV